MNPCFRVLAVSSIPLALLGCGAECENEQIAVSPSPSGSTRAVVFNRSCGATVGFNTQVSVLRGKSPPPNEPGNTLILEGQVPLRLLWKSESELTVVGSLGSKPFKREGKIGAVAVVYE